MTKDIARTLATTADMDINDSMYCQLLAIISHLEGVYGGGGLTGQHLLHVGAFIGIYPTKYYP